MTKRMDNIEFVTDLMTYGGPHGPLTQLFILTAIEKYAEQCIKAGPDIFDNGLINGQAWFRTAAHLKEALDKRYK